MYTVTNIYNGVNYKMDVVKSFQDALDCECNKWADGSINWDYVAADMHMDLSTWYAASYIDEAFEYMVELEMEDKAAAMAQLEYV